MTSTYNIAGGSGFFGNMMRGIMVAAATFGGLFMLAASAAVAFFIVMGLVVLAALAFGVFWIKSKITGRTPSRHSSTAHHSFRRQGTTQTSGRDFDLAFGAKADTSASGPVLDAQPTPHGWSVED